MYINVKTHQEYQAYILVWNMYVSSTGTLDPSLVLKLKQLKGKIWRLTVYQWQTLYCQYVVDMTWNKHIQCIYYFVSTKCQCQIYMYFMFCSWILVQLSYMYKSLMYFEIKKSWTFQLLCRQLSHFCADVICVCADVFFFLYNSHR